MFYYSKLTQHIHIYTRITRTFLRPRSSLLDSPVGTFCGHCIVAWAIARGLHIAAIAQEKRGHFFRACLVQQRSTACTVWLVVKRNATFERGQLDTCEMPEENPNVWNVGRGMLVNLSMLNPRREVPSGHWTNFNVEKQIDIP